MHTILAGRTDQALMLEQLERPLPASWVEQRRFLDRAPERLGIPFLAEEAHARRRQAEMLGWVVCLERSAG